MAELDFNARASIPPALRFKTTNHPLARSHYKWGVSFLGTKTELQAAGFGAKAIFPGEPGGNKKKATLPACNGFLRVDVEIYGDRRWLGEPSQDAEPNYVITAHYLADDDREKRVFHLTQWPNVSLHYSVWGDVYKGTKESLIAAGVAKEEQFPGMPGCGKLSTTFDSAGERVFTKCASSLKHGYRKVSTAGKQFEVLVYAGGDELEARRILYFLLWDIKKADAARKIDSMVAEFDAMPKKRHLRLV